MRQIICKLTNISKFSINQTELSKIEQDMCNHYIELIWLTVSLQIFQEQAHVWQEKTKYLPVGLKSLGSPYFVVKTNVWLVPYKKKYNHKN